MQTHFCKCGCGQPCFKTFKKGHQMKARIANGTWKNPMLSPESRHKLSESVKKARKRKFWTTNKGKLLSEERRKQLSLSMKAKNLKGDKNPSKRPEVREKISHKLKGRKFSEEHNHKLVKARIIYYASPEYKQYIKEHHEVRSAISKEVWKKPEYREKVMRNSLKRLFGKRPTSYEAKVLQVIEKHQLPFKYVGDGEIIISRKNPDFIATDGRKLLIEVYGVFFKKPSYETERAKVFELSGYKTMFLNDGDIQREDFEGICLRKIQAFCSEPTSIIPMQNLQ